MAKLTKTQVQQLEAEGRYHESMVARLGTETEIRFASGNRTDMTIRRPDGFTVTIQITAQMED